MRPSRAALRELLSTGRPVKQAEAADELGVTQRHVRRLVRDLQAEGVPVEEQSCGRERAYVLPPDALETGTVHLTVSAREALALSVASDAAQALLRDTPLSRPLADVFERMLRALAPQVLLLDLDDQRGRWFFSAVAHQQVDPEVMGVVLVGLNRQQSILIDYRKKGADCEGWRKVDPLCVAIIGNALMLTAFCHQRQEPREFAFVRMADARLCDPSEDRRPYFDRPEGFEPARYFGQNRFSALAGGEVRVFRMLVEPEVAHYFQERDYHHTQDVEETREDGRIVVSFMASSIDEMRSFCQGWGTAITVLEPPELVERMRADAATLLARYGIGEVRGET